METVFTPWQSLGGGVLIGFASTLLMLFLGRIMGATGILAGLLAPSTSHDKGWRLAVLLGMVSGPLAVLAISGQMPELQVPVSLPMLIVGAFIVGIGVTYASGCTSGHGVCGIARLSRRSIAATTDFHDHDRTDRLCLASRLGNIRYAPNNRLRYRPGLRHWHLDLRHGQSGQGGEFFDVVGAWDPSLIFVMGGAVVVAFIGYRFVLQRRSPVLADSFQLPTNTRLDVRLIGGSAVFGIGWGISGFCPGGALPALGTGRIEVLAFVAALVAGILTAKGLIAFIGSRALPGKT